ncbi:hypothetical protein GGR34_003833 [Microvirga flocculans]|uniref:Uncharacterized protein n=1 Tax=Microvirga flocculans TaxID=217168 RepID=A0A7W6N9D7_9HYPH|nr:hypothetical protein [Microvirga flocculans]MBB4042148.1 hypothetical protein [Microvirga flocculans]
MLLSASEGRHWRYEVCEHEDGYLVQMRDLTTGELDEDFSTIFRTLPVAFAYAEMSAAYERYAACELELSEGELIDLDIGIDVEATERHFIDLSDRLHDSGINGVVIQAWERESQRGTARILH